MFNFFSKEDHSGYGVFLAKNAEIETVYDQGKVEAFFILIEDAEAIFNKIKEKETYSAFVSAIEERIRKKEFKDDTPALLYALEAHLPSLGDDKNEEVNFSMLQRLVCTPEFKVIFSWNNPS